MGVPPPGVSAGTNVGLTSCDSVSRIKKTGVTDTLLALERSILGLKLDVLSHFEDFLVKCF